MLLKFNLHFLCMLFGCIEFAAGEAFYITPSPNLPCPQQYCYTLTQFINYAKSNLISNTTLYFLPGTHSLQSELVIGNISELQLLSVSDSSSKMVTVSCGPTARLLIENVHFVHINCLHFDGCSENKIESVHQFIIINSTYHGPVLQDTNGTALELVHTNAKIINSSFLYNYGSYRGPIGLLHYLIMRQQIPPQSLYALVGGALIVNCSNLSVTGSMFEGNIAEIGGAIFSEGSSNIALTDCSFIDNHAYELKSSTNYMHFGGAIFSESGPYNSTVAITTRASIILINSKFINNTALTEGGAIAAYFIQIEILKCRFLKNSAQIGGGVMKVIKCQIMINDSCLDLNTADSAGVIHAVTDSLISITNSRFSGNTASSVVEGAGGVLGAFGFTHITMMESTFYNNSAQSEAGIVSIDTVCNLIILQCRFSVNKASKGGVIWADFQSNVTILDSDFNKNTAYESGGVLSIQAQITLVIANTTFKDNTANVGGVLMQERNTLATVKNSTFYRNFASDAGGVFTSQILSQIQLSNCEFVDNRAVLKGGVGMALHQSGVSIIDSSALNNTSPLGGAVYAIKNCFIQIEKCQFNGNKAINAHGGVVAIEHFSKLHIKDCEFCNNKALLNGGVVYISTHSYGSINSTQFGFNLATKGGVIDLSDQANAIIIDCNFSENSGKGNGGVINLNTRSALRLTLTTLEKNRAGSKGGAISIGMYATAVIEESTFTENGAFLGGSLYFSNSNHIFITNTLISKSFASTGAVFMLESKVTFAENVEIISNFGSIYVMNSEFYLQGNTTFENNILGSPIGGALTIYRGNVYIGETTHFKNNIAENGAAIYATTSNIFVGGNATIINNTARYNGGGIYLYQSPMQCNNTCSLKLVSNHALHSGGGIYAVSSTIDILSSIDQQLPSLLLLENSAHLGGGLYMEAYAKIYISKTESDHTTNETVASCSSVVFSDNFADYGGAVFVEDGTNLGVCDSNPHQVSSLIQERTHCTNTQNPKSAAECFFEVLSLDQQFNKDYANDSINFTQNYAHSAGSTLFGGLLDRCIPGPLTTDLKPYYDGISYLKHVSNILVDTISSHPVKLCICNNSQPDCSYLLPIKQLKKGENFTVTLVAVDQVNCTISNTTIRASLKFAESGFGEGQLIQTTGDSCTDLTYSVTTTYEHEQIIVYAEGPCRDSSMSQKQIDIQFIPCSCPIGFQQKDTENTNCVCICDTDLLPYVSGCNARDETVTKSSDAWLSYVDQALNSSGYLIHDHCPFDYCLSPNSDREIKVNLNEKTGADAQCAHNRIGTLCGACKHGFSLSLGSSHCIPCSHWHTNLTVILSAAIFSGVILVVMLLVLNLTVAVGTLNGIIFYANIVGSNFSTFFPFSLPNFVTMFISWLNLDIGIDTCFFKGMNAYWKVWIDLLFPAYLIGLVILIIIVSEKSTKFAWLLGRKNPVATLATLILLSYTKLLRTIILSFSFAALKYPDDSIQLVWLPDATVKYFSAKHVALFVVALIIVIAGAVYTLLLFFWQWILLHQNKCLFKWANDRRLSHFLDPYHAPYVYEHRYWTGLLLLIRAVLYVITAVNVSNDPGINLLAIAFVVFSILLLKGCLKRNKIYRQWRLELIEMLSYINLTFFCLMSFYLLEDKTSQGIVAYISGSIALILFVIILFYHISFEFILKFKFWKRLLRNEPLSIRSETLTDLEDDSDTETDRAALIAPPPTSSIVEAPPTHEQPLSALVELGKD